MTRKIRTPGQLPTGSRTPFDNIPVVTDAMFQQDVEPHSDSFDVLARRLARKAPEWAAKKSSPGARAGTFLRTMRNAAGLSQSKLGELAQLNQSDISSLENSDSPQGPSFDVIARFADACGFHLTFEAKTEAMVEVNKAVVAEVADTKPSSAPLDLTAAVRAIERLHKRQARDPRNKFAHSKSRHAVYTYVMHSSGELEEFVGKSPEVEDDGIVLIENAGQIFGVSVEAPGAKVAIKRARIPSISSYGSVRATGYVRASK